MSQRSKWKGKAIVFAPLLSALLAFFAYTHRTIEGTPLSRKQAIAKFPSFYQDFGRLLKKYVDSDGMVDYKKLKQEKLRLDTFVGIIATISPQNEPSLFQSKTAKLTYWINTYNLLVLRNMLEFDSAEDLHSLWRRYLFFKGHRFVIGGDEWNLYNLEHVVIRQRFQEARAHFAINCASYGCPTLSTLVFLPGSLEQRLEQETKKFIHEQRNVEVDHKKKTVHLSAIFQWYRADFLAWKPLSSKSKKILAYINLFRKKGSHIPLSYQVRYVPYDWRINRHGGVSRTVSLKRLRGK